jgi:hypothetical protein
MFASCFTDPVYADASGGGIPAATISRADLVALVSIALSGFTATQHISPNHVIEFDASDPGRAICHSYMYAQHLLRGSENGEFCLLRGSYTNHMLRTGTADGSSASSSAAAGNTETPVPSPKPSPGPGADICLTRSPTTLLAACRRA